MSDIFLHDFVFDMQDIPTK